MADHIKVPGPYLEETHLGYTGTGPLIFDFPYVKSDDIVVTVDGLVLDPSLWQNNEGMDLVGGFDGGEITLTNAVTDADVVISRCTDPSRPNDFPVNGIRPDVLNSELDRIAMSQQEFKRFKEIIEASFTGLTTPTTITFLEV